MASGRRAFWRTGTLTQGATLIVRLMRALCGSPRRQASHVTSQPQDLIDAARKCQLAVSRHEKAQIDATARCATWVYFGSM